METKGGENNGDACFVSASSLHNFERLVFSKMVLLSPSDVLRKGLAFLGVQFKSANQNNLEFHKHYGSAPLDLAEMWYDLTVTDIPEAQMDDKEKSEMGFKMFMITHFWLWTYPKNAHLIASRFKTCVRYLRGEPLWKWIERIAALKVKKIIWDHSLEDANTEVFAISLDGTDFRMWERKHPVYHATTVNARRNSTMVLLSMRLRSLCFELSAFILLVSTEEGCTTWRCFAGVV